MATTLTTLFDAFPGVFLVTDPHARVLYTNRSIQRVTGFDVPEIVGKKPAELWGRQMKRGYYKKMWKTLTDGRRPFISSVVNKRKDGTVYEDTLTLAPILDGGGAPMYFIAARPDGLSKREQKAFQKEFQTIFSKEQTKVDIAAEHLYKWIGKSARVSPDFSVATVAELLCEHFIEPTRKTYAYREEDKQLVLAAQQDSEAFGVLFAKYQQSILGYFSRRVPDLSIAADLTQETFARAFSYLPSFTPSNSSYQTYLIRIAHNLLVNYYRRAALRKTDDIEAYHHIGNGEDQEVRVQQKWGLSRARKKLTEREAQIFSLFYEEGLRVREIATAIDTSENAVKLHLSRARKKMRRYLKEE